jgi:hypothetical protein
VLAVVRPHDGSGEDRWSRLESAAQSPDRPFSLVRATGAEGFRISAPAQLATAVSPVLGSPWREILPDTSMSATRAASIGVVGPWIDKCTDAGFGAAERDSLDSAGRVHDRGLAVGRKYACHSVGREDDVGLYCAVADGLQNGRQEVLELAVNYPAECEGRPQRKGISTTPADAEIAGSDIRPGRRISWVADAPARRNRARPGDQGRGSVPGPVCGDWKGPAGSAGPLPCSGGGAWYPG